MATACSMSRSATSSMRVDLVGDDRAGERARLLDRDPFRQRVAADLAARSFDDILHRRIELGFDPDHFDLGIERLGGDGDAADQPAAADGNDQDVEIGHFGEDFERDGAGAGDDLAVVERVDEDECLLRLELAGMVVGVVKGLPVEQDPRAVALGLGDLYRRGRIGHDDGHGNAEALAVLGDRLGMVAGRCGDDPALAFVIGQLE